VVEVVGLVLLPLRDTVCLPLKELSVQRVRLWFVGFCSCGIHSPSDSKAYILQDILEQMGVSQKHATEV